MLEALALLACAHVEEAVVTVPATWEVYSGSDVVLTMRDEPGPLTSTAIAPPGFVPPTHPFLTAAAQDAGHEDRLRQILDASSDPEDFRARLRASGYRVVRR